MDGSEPIAAGRRPRQGVMESVLEWVFLLSRWLMVPVLLSLLAVPVLIASRVWLDVWHLFTGAGPPGRVTVILAALHLIDLVLVASLVLMVALSVYEEMVSRIDVSRERPVWLGKLDSARLKVRVVLSIVAIATIELLATSLEVDSVSDRSLGWGLGIYVLFLVSALVLVLALRVAGHDE